MQLEERTIESIKRLERRHIRLCYISAILLALVGVVHLATPKPSALKVALFVGVATANLMFQLYTTFRLHHSQTTYLIELHQYVSRIEAQRQR